MTSRYVLDAAERARTLPLERDARIRPFLEADLYLIYAEPKRGEFYAPETEWPALVSRRSALAHLKQCDDAAYVVYRPAAGAPRDVSEDFARAWFAELAEAGADPVTDGLPAFISRHLTNRDADDYCAARADEVGLMRETCSPERTGRI